MMKTDGFGTATGRQPEIADAAGDHEADVAVA
jgi:hypothetical protein